MNELDHKILEAFPGMVVRKDLTTLMKKGANVPTYVLEYLLGMYCSSDNEQAIQIGISKIKKVLTENYVKPEQSEMIKSRIREQGSYTIIDKITVSLYEHEDIYIARFSSLNIDSFEISADIVKHNIKLLSGGIWCIVRIEYQKPIDDTDEYDAFGNKIPKKKKKKSKYSSPFNIVSLKPIQMPNLNLEKIIDKRTQFTKEEWIAMILRSAGYEPSHLSLKEQFHYLLRLVPFIQKNYNLVELGPRGTGKSHVYSELSPYSILMSSGHTTVANMFYNMSRHSVGLVGSWDCIAFDEVGGMQDSSGDMVQIMKNYMANGSFARGTEAYNADASIAFEGNTFHSVSDMLRTTTLFEPFPESFNHDSAFFDRIHAYLPGWETPKLRSALFTSHYGLISDCLSEFCHEMRVYDFTNTFAQFFSLNDHFNTRDEIAVRRTFSGMAKLIYPHEQLSKEECREVLVYSIEGRRRVKEQLRKMNPSEFSDVQLGYVDLDTNEEFIVTTPEQANRTLIFDGFETPGYVYAIGNSLENKVGVYRLENKLLSGTGKFDSRNVEGLPSRAKPVKDSIHAAFNYFSDNHRKLIATNFDEFDYTLYYNDLQNRGVSDEISVAQVVGLFSAISKTPVTPGLVVCGRVVMSGAMLPLSSEISDILAVANNAGAKRVLLPVESQEKVQELSETLTEMLQIVYYTTPLDAARKALLGGN